MIEMKRVLIISAVLAVLAASVESRAWSIRGDRIWAQRTGPGVSFSMGLNNCTDDYCDDFWDTNTSIGAFVGFYYQIITNAAVYVDIHTGHLGVDMDGRNDDAGLMFHVSGGGEFHVPIVGWASAFTGFGIGFAYLGAWTEWDRVGDDDEEEHFALFGFNFDLKFGGLFYPFSRVPHLGFGPILRFSIPKWIRHCYDNFREAGGRDDCSEPEEFRDDDDLPRMVYFGIMGRTVF